MDNMQQSHTLQYLVAWHSLLTLPLRVTTGMQDRSFYLPKQQLVPVTNDVESYSKKCTAQLPCEHPYAP